MDLLVYDQVRNRLNHNNNYSHNRLNGYNQNGNGNGNLGDRDLLLYDDRFCQLTNKSLIIKNYYYPSGKSIKVPINTIIGVQHERGHVDWKTCKGWGMSLNHIWWARDMAREFDTGRYSVVVQANDNYNRCGFSVENIKTFLTCLGSVVGDQASFEDKIYG